MLFNLYSNFLSSIVKIRIHMILEKSYIKGRRTARKWF